MRPSLQSLSQKDRIPSLKWINKSINQSIHQSINQPTGQPLLNAFFLVEQLKLSQIRNSNNYKLDLQYTLRSVVSIVVYRYLPWVSLWGVFYKTWSGRKRKGDRATFLPFPATCGWLDSGIWSSAVVAKKKGGKKNSWQEQSGYVNLIILAYSRDKWWIPE